MVSGSGTSGDPYILYNLSDLEQIPTLGLDKYYKLGADIDASATADPDYNSGAGWLPVGDGTPFTGYFDGDGYTISGLYINRPTTNGIGFFGSVSYPAYIHDLTLSEVDITGQDYTGGIIGYFSCSNSYFDDNLLYECTVTGEITGRDYTGGLCGECGTNGYGGSITYCNFNGILTGNSQVGGVCGDFNNYHTIGYCTVTGEITGTGDRIAGVAGSCTGNYIITNINLNGNDLTINVGESSNYIGSIVGYATYTAVYATSINTIRVINFSISGYDYVGGIVGQAGVNGYPVSLIDCYYQGDVSGRNYIGGICGYWGGGESRVTSGCEYRGVITATGSYIGGIHGAVYPCGFTITENTINGRYVTFDVENSDYVGGISGWISNGNASGGVTSYNIVTNLSISGRDFIGGVCGKLGNSGYGGQCQYNSVVNVSLSGRSYIGGLIGFYESYQQSIMCNFTSGLLAGTGSYHGGLIGRSGAENYGGGGNITDNYSLMDVTGYSHAGGLIGYNYNRPIINCYSKGAVSGNDNYGGLIGGGTVNVTSSFWDTETSTQSSSPGGGTGKTTAEMKTQSTYTNWDFSTPIWLIGSLNEGYPTLYDPPFIVVGDEEESIILGLFMGGKRKRRGWS